MSTNCARSIYLRLLVKLLGIVLLTCLSATGDPGFTSLHGEVQCDGCGPRMNLTVELYDASHHRFVDRAFTVHGGSFEFPRVRTGSYLVRVAAENGESLREEVLQVQEFNRALVIRISRASAAAPAIGPVSLRRLNHKIPGRARKAYQRAGKLRARGDLNGSLAQLFEAVKTDPEYMEAYNNIGVRYMELHAPDRALPAFARAVELDPSLAASYTNLAIAQMHTLRVTDAEATARRALHLDPLSAKARYTLGLALSLQRKFTPEALNHLLETEGEFPAAQVAAAQVLAAQGRKEEARTKLRSYLNGGLAERRRDAELLLKRLQ